MYKTLSIAILLLILTVPKSQAQSISLVGEAQSSYSPDRVELRIEVKTGRKGFDNSMKRLEKKTSRVRDELKKLALEETEWHVDDYGLKNAIVKKRRRYVDSGYVVRQYVIVRMNYDLIKLQRILGHFSKRSLKHKYFVSFYFSEEMKNRIRTDMIKAASSNARVQLSGIESELGIKAQRIIDVEVLNNIDFPTPVPATIYLEDVPIMLEERPGFNEIQRKQLTFTKAIKIVWEL